MVLQFVRSTVWYWISIVHSSEFCTHLLLLFTLSYDIGYFIYLYRYHMLITPLQSQHISLLMQINRPHLYVMAYGMVFSVIISFIIHTSPPIDVELFLFSSILDPIVAHVNRFGSFLLNCLVGKSHRCCVIYLDRCGWLWMSHVPRLSGGVCTITSVPGGAKGVLL